MKGCRLIKTYPVRMSKAEIDLRAFLVMLFSKSMNFFTHVFRADTYLYVSIYI
jgi:hypothetical protein